MDIDKPNPAYRKPFTSIISNSGVGTATITWSSGISSKRYRSSYMALDNSCISLIKKKGFFPLVNSNILYKQRFQDGIHLTIGCENSLSAAFKNLLKKENIAFSKSG